MLNLPALRVVVCYVTLIIGILLFIPQFRTAYFVTQTRIFDVGAYVDIAIQGCKSSAQYAWQPLWPLHLRQIHFLLPPSWDLGLAASLFSVCLFFAGILILRSVLDSIYGKKVADLTLILFLCQPLGVFFFIGYSESLSLFLGSFLILVWLKSNVYHSAILKLGVFLIAMAVSLGRPQWMQMLVAMVSSSVLLTLVLLLSVKNGALKSEQYQTWVSVPEKMHRHFKNSTFVMAGLVTGYVLICLFGYYKTGNAFASVDAQKHWGKVIQPHWSLFYAPKAASNSSNVLLLGLFTFYVPPLCFLGLVWSLIRWGNLNFKRIPLGLSGIETHWTKSYFLLFGLAFCAVQSGIQFLRAAPF